MSSNFNLILMIFFFRSEGTMPRRPAKNFESQNSSDGYYNLYQTSVSFSIGVCLVADMGKLHQIVSIAVVRAMADRE